jgi:hypothetical protein
MHRPDRLDRPGPMARIIDYAGDAIAKALPAADFST